MTRSIRGWEGIGGLAAPTERHALDDLRNLLPTSPAAARETIREAVTWLINNLGDPRVVAARCAELSPAITGLGVPPQRLETLAILLIDALRANPPSPPLRADEEAALRDAGRLIARWTTAGAEASAHEPTRWSALVTQHDRRRADMAVLHLRTYLPYPCPPGARAVVELPNTFAGVPGRRRGCWVGNRPLTDRGVELHVAVQHDDPIGAALVERTKVGDRIQLHLPVGDPAPLADNRPLLLVADRDAIAPIRAILDELRSAATATTERNNAERSITVYWPAPTERDALQLAELAPPGALVIRDRFTADIQERLTTDGRDRSTAGRHDRSTTGGRDPSTTGRRDRLTTEGRDWSEHCAYIAGTAATTTADAAHALEAGIPAERTVIASIG
ncbi:hypothetical protein [Dactylosporangium sp. CS-033363]|uniref:hypothetical protein n=1 Tax=Dactylosporangium sp. CS-033363 TaxID=3239935 RepID=UPI003D8BA65E